MSGKGGEMRHAVLLFQVSGLLIWVQEGQCFRANPQRALQRSNRPDASPAGRYHWMAEKGSARLGCNSGDFGTDYYQRHRTG